MSADVFDDFENGDFKTAKDEALLKSLRQRYHDTLPITEAILRETYNHDNAGLFAYYYNIYVLLNKYIKEEETSLSDLRSLFRYPLVDVHEEWKDYLPELIEIHPGYGPFVGVGKLKNYSRMDLSRPIVYRLEHDMPELHISELK